MRVEDCSAYAVFLGTFRTHWISRRKASPGDIGWAPFRGQLSAASSTALTVVSALFSWLHSARYIHGSPWALINAKEASGLTHTASEIALLDSRPSAGAAMQEVLHFVEGQSPPLLGTGFDSFCGSWRPSVCARQSCFRPPWATSTRPEGWFLASPAGQPAPSVVALPGQAFAALQRSLSERGLGGVETAPPHAPLLANVADAMEPSPTRRCTST